MKPFSVLAKIPLPFTHTHTHTHTHKLAQCGMNTTIWMKYGGDEGNRVYMSGRTNKAGIALSENYTIFNVHIRDHLHEVQC